MSRLYQILMQSSIQFNSTHKRYNPAMTPTAPYKSFPNSFTRDLLAGKKLIGCWSSLASPITAEVLGLAGFDWILLDGEHSPNDVNTFIPQLMALKDSPTAPIVRPSCNSAFDIKRLLDAGFYNFLVPFVESAEEARNAVSATRYPPQGIRGVAVSQRSNRYGSIPASRRLLSKQPCQDGEFYHRSAPHDYGPVPQHP
jgi:2-dehydro-3-deoxyglucarate aldolase